MRRLSRPLLFAGIVAIISALSKYHAARIGHYDLTGSFRFVWMVLHVVLSCMIAYGFGLPDLPRRARSAVAVSLLAVVFSALSVSVLQLLAGSALLPRFVVFGSSVLLFPWYLVMVGVASTGRSASEQRDRVLVVGAPELADELVAELEAQPERPAVVVARLTAEHAAAVQPQALPLVDAVLANGCTVVVLGPDAQVDDAVVAQAATLHEAGVRVRTKSLFFEEWLGKIPISDLARVSLFFDIGELHREQYGRFKRLLDLVFGTVGVVGLALVLPFVVIGDLAANRGHLFYSQDRVGRGGRTFRIYKFRTMRDLPGAETVWTENNDPRVTPFGRLLRTSHLDELPQVVNILRGDLSLVGPRPEQPHYVTELAARLPYYQLRHLVRPGLTGWAQVKYGYASDQRDALEKLQYDVHYLRRQSLVFDLRIIGRTVRTVLGRGGR